MRTHCRKGHEFTAENVVYQGTAGKRRCRICANAKGRASYWRHREKNIQRGLANYYARKAR